MLLALLLAVLPCPYKDKCILPRSKPYPTRNLIIKKDKEHSKKNKK